VQWTVNAATAGTAKLTIRYANGTTASRPMTLMVNGAAAGTLDFPPTGSWDTWAAATVTVPLAAGANTVRATATTATGGPNLDCLDVEPQAPPPPSTRYEAENATISQGVVESNHLGFTGTGFANTVNAVGAFVDIPVTAAAAGTKTLSFRYSDGTTVARPATISVNGTSRGTLNFPITANWDTWATASISVPLTAGTNTIRVTGTTAGGAANIDSVTVS
jgi:hypothetical protein